METPIIPSENDDLIALVRKRDRHFLTQWLVSTALTTVLAIACFGLAMNSYGLLVAILLALVLVVLPFLLCGGIEWITDRGFTGTVESMKFSVRIDMTGVTGNLTVKSTGGRKRVIRSHNNGQVNYCTLHVITDEGSCKTLTLRLPGDTEDFPLKTGDHIVKYRGLPFPAVVGCKTPFCVVCGRVDDDGKGTCRTCDSSLILLPLE